MAGEPTLRERKKQRTRQALIDAARHLFEQQGYEATTVAQIAAAAEVSTRTFFSYFSSKEDVIRDNSAERLEAGIRVLTAAAPQALPHVALTRAFDEMLEDNWTIGLVAGLSGRDLPLPLSSPKGALARSNARLDRIAEALAGAYPDVLDRVTAYAMAGAAIGAVSAAAAASMVSGCSDEQAVTAARQACQHTTAGFAAAHGWTVPDEAR